MSRVAVLGGRDAVLGFKASGAVVFCADSPDEAREALSSIQASDFAILLVTEDVAEALKTELAPLYEMPKPVITVLPDAKKARGQAMAILQKRVERALGANILLKGEE